MGNIISQCYSKLGKSDKIVLLLIGVTVVVALVAGTILTVLSVLVAILALTLIVVILILFLIIMLSEAGGKRLSDFLHTIRKTWR